jgi:MoaA/NifB/PqqE/SkfB family radical SAM enzyme
MRYKPISAVIHITSKCNLTCEGCHVRGWYNEKKDLSSKIFEKRIRELAHLGIKKIRLAGMEPTMHHKLEELIKIARRYVSGVGIFTNGSGYNSLKDAMERVHRWKEAGLSRIRVSVDAIHNTNKYGNKIPVSLSSVIYLLIASLNYLDGVDDIGIHYIINKSGYKETNKIIEQVIDGVRKKSGRLADKITKKAIPLIPLGRFHKYNLDDFSPESRKEICLQHERSENSLSIPRIIIAMNGDIYSCPFMGIKLGNIDERPLQNILTDDNKLIEMYERVGLREVKRVLVEKGLIKEESIESLPCKLCYNLSRSKYQIDLVYRELNH